MNLIEVCVSLLLISTLVLAAGIVGLRGITWLKEAQTETSSLIALQNAHHEK